MVFQSNVLACRTTNDVGIVERIKETDAPCYRPPIPQQESEGVHPGILTLMKQCWAEEPSERPSFNDITRSLKIINKGKSVCFLLFHFVYNSKHLLLVAHFLINSSHISFRMTYDCKFCT